MTTSEAQRFIARMQTEGHALDLAAIEGEPVPYMITVEKFGGLAHLDRRRLSIHFEEICLELATENFRLTGVCGRNARRAAKQFLILLRMGFTAKELHSLRYAEGRVEVVPKCVAVKRTN